MERSRRLRLSLVAAACGFGAALASCEDETSAPQSCVDLATCCATISDASTRMSCALAAQGSDCAGSLSMFRAQGYCAEGAGGAGRGGAGSGGQGGGGRSLTS